MGILAEGADHRTGRDVKVSIATIMDRTHLSRSTVRRHLAAAREARLLRDVAEGRHLTRGEGARAVRTMGWRPEGRAPIRALCMPAHLVQNHVHAGQRDLDAPPRFFVVEFFSSVGREKPTRAHTREAQSDPRSRRRGRRSRCDRTPRPLWVQRLSAELVDRWTWLGKGHIGAVCDALTSSGITEDWTSRDVADAVDRWHQDRHWEAQGIYARNPIGWLRIAVTRALEDYPIPSSRLAAERAAEAEKRTSGHIAARHTPAPDMTPAAIAARDQVRRNVAVAKTERAAELHRQDAERADAEREARQAKRAAWTRPTPPPVDPAEAERVRERRAALVAAGEAEGAVAWRDRMRAVTGL